jgi:hypothetical protein
LLRLQLATIPDPFGDDGRILSVDGVRVRSSDPDDPTTRRPDAKPVRPVKPQAVKDAEELLVEAGEASSWWANVGNR